MLVAGGFFVLFLIYVLISIGIILALVGIGLFLWLRDRRKGAHINADGKHEVKKRSWISTFLVLTGIIVPTAAIFPAVIFFFSALQAIPPEKFGVVSGITIDQEGKVYVLDWWNDRIQIFDSDHNYITGWHTEVTDVAVDRDGNIYGIEGWTEKITKYSNSGAILKEWGATRQAKEATLLADIAWDSKGHLYVVDIRETVRKYSTDGQLLATWGLKQTPDYNETSPDLSSIAIDSDDNIFVLDALTATVHVFKLISEFPDDKNGSLGCKEENVIASGICYVTTWDAAGGHQALAVDSKGFVYIMEVNAIKKYTKDGDLVFTFGENGAPKERKNWRSADYGDIAVDGNDFVYASDNNCGWIIKYTSDGKYLTKWGDSSRTDYPFSESLPC